jgi:hypothetical protein
VPRKSKLTALLLLALLFMRPLYADPGSKTLTLNPVFEFQLLDKLKPLAGQKKSELETTAAFGDRACKALTDTLGVERASSLTFPVKFGQDGIAVRYDADKSKIEIRLPLKNDGVHVISRKTEWKISARTYAVFREDVSLRLSASSKNLGVPSITFPANLDLAKLKGDLRVAIAGYLEAPCFDTQGNLAKPGDPSPRDLIYRLHLGPKSEWIVYRANTKEIVKRGRFD